MDEWIIIPCCTANHACMSTAKTVYACVCLLILNAWPISCKHTPTLWSSRALFGMKMTGEVCVTVCGMINLSHQCPLNHPDTAPSLTCLYLSWINLFHHVMSIICPFTPLLLFVLPHIFLPLSVHFFLFIYIHNLHPHPR